jgi:hypothetical protein
MRQWIDPQIRKSSDRQIRRSADRQISNTINSLEATNDHMNEAISRRNSFQASVSILSNHVAYKMLHFDAALTRDFRTALK